MTVAICIRCGAFKFGAFCPCEKCGAWPETEDEYVASFVFTDHFNNMARLEKIGERIASGIKIHVEPGTLEPDMMETIRQIMRSAKLQKLRNDEPPGSDGSESKPEKQGQQPPTQ